MKLTPYIIAATLVFSLPQAAPAGTDSARASAPPAGRSVDSLPPVGKEIELLKPYPDIAPAPSRSDQQLRSPVSNDRVNTPYSREVVPPAYRYGTPGYMPDGRGGRGYDFGYPGYRPWGGGGYPHQRR